MHEEFCRRIVAAANSGKPINIVGGSSKSFLGRSVAGDDLHTAGYTGLVHYDPAELVITVKAGSRLKEVEEVLSASGQMLPFEPPIYSDRSTIGGVVAAGLSGPARSWRGSVRDYVLGIKCINGKGQVLQFGGQVIKNVAGYDASRLLTGSMGTLALILEVSFKVLPKPETESTVVLEMSESRAITYLSELGLRPLPLSASCYLDDRLYLRFSGSQVGVAAAIEQIDGDIFDDQEFWQQIRNQKLDFFNTSNNTLWRLSVPPAASPWGLAGNMLIEWGGALRWLKSDLPTQVIRDAAVSAGGSAMQFRNGDRQEEIYHPLEDVVFRLNKNLKNSFDPDGVFNPGRMYAGI